MRRRRSVLRVLLGAWMAAGVIAGIAPVLGRWIAPPPAAAATALLPRARPDGRLRVIATPPFSASPFTSRAAPWLTLHILYASCQCSENVFAHLLQRGPIAGTRERIVLVTGRRDDAAAARYGARAAAAGFVVDTVTPDELARRFGVEGAPLLVVADPTGRIRYAGGYTDGRQGKEPLVDEAIVADLMAGRGSADPPLLAAAVSRRLQDAFELPRSRDRPTAP